MYNSVIYNNCILAFSQVLLSVVKKFNILKLLFSRQI